MKIEIKEDIKTLMGKNSVYYKDDKFYVGEINYFTIMKILRFVNNSLYKELLEDKETTKYAINSIIFDNKGISNEDLISYINSLSASEIKGMGQEYLNYLFETLKEFDFQKDKFKALIRENYKINYALLFNQFPNLKILFVYDDKTNVLKIINKDGRILKTKKIKPDELDKEFEKFKEYQIKEEDNNYWNKLIKEILDKLFNLEVFFEEFKEEIFNRILQILNIVDLSDENLELLDKYDKEEGFNETLSKLISKKINERNKKLEKKYGLKL